MKTRDLIFISLFTALAVAGAFLRIPFPFLSVTFQMLFALIAGIILGPIRGMAAMLIYMILGLAGLPVFSQGGGIGYVLQPSFGFILGFIPGAFISGFVYEKLKLISFAKVLISYSAGTFIVYLIGISYMLVILKFYLGNTGMSFAATTISMIPYLTKDIILGLLAASLGRFIPRLKALTE